MDIPQQTDLTTSSRSTFRITQQFRAGLGASYSVGACVKIAAQDFQAYTDGLTILPTAAVSQDLNIQGLVTEDWAGFSGTPSPIVTMSNASNLARGTQGVKVSCYGYHPAGLIDQGGATIAAITNGALLNSSTRTSGRMQGVSSSNAFTCFAMLATTGLASNLTAAALAQASQTFTITGAPAAGDTLTVNVQGQFAGSLSSNTNNIPSPGVAQTISTVTTLTSAQAASVTTAATAVAAALNANPNFARYYVATSAAGVVTVTVNALSAPFFISFPNGGAFNFSLSGSAANGILFSGSATGGSIGTAGSTALAGGAGFFGTIPVFVATL